MNAGIRNMNLLSGVVWHCRVEVRILTGHISNSRPDNAVGVQAIPNLYDYASTVFPDERLMYPIDGSNLELLA